MQMRSQRGQRGFSLIGLLCTLSMFGLIGLLMVRAGPTVIEYWAINKAVSAARMFAKTPAEIAVSIVAEIVQVKNAGVTAGFADSSCAVPGAPAV